MLLSQWIERVGRLVAPDENYYGSGEAEQREFEPDPVLSILAPDPNFVYDLSKDEPARESSSDLPTFVECERCHHSTPVRRLLQTTPSTPHSARSSTISTPHGRRRRSLDSNGPMDPIRAAAMKTEWMTSPQFRNSKIVKRLFKSFMQSSADYEAKQGDKLRDIIEKYPELLTEARTYATVGLGCAVPEGYTPLMAACHLNLMPACRILLEHNADLTKRQLLECNNSGQTALHIAAQKGHAEIVTYLAQSMRRLNLPLDSLDVLGRTPLGAGLTSPEAKRKPRYQTQLLQEFNGPKDASVVGTPLPLAERTVRASDALNISVAFAEMPGVRVHMEDAILVHVDEGKVVVGVCDGHDDGGNVSEFVSEKLLEEVKEVEPDNDWMKVMPQSFLSVDEKLRKADLSGGSTCVAAVVTSDKIFVANAGDSRCILIQMAQQDQDISEQIGKLSLAQPSDSQDGTADGWVVTPLSVDHKPNLPNEEPRIKNAGVDIVNDNGFIRMEIRDGLNNSSLATSRGFGDFEFKTASELPAEEQAVTVLPEMVAHDRSDLDRYLILACDGVFDVLTNEQVASFVCRYMNQYDGGTEKPVGLAKAADALLQECLRLQSGDNMSVVIVALQAPSIRGVHEELKAQLDAQFNDCESSE